MPKISTMGEFSRSPHARFGLAHRESGLSLLEALAGMILLAVVLLTLLPLATVWLTSSDQVQDAVRAQRVLDELVERLRAEPVVTDGSLMDPESGTFSHWWVEAGAYDLRKIHVEVIWYTETGLARHQRATTYVTLPDSGSAP